MTKRQMLVSSLLAGLSFLSPLMARAQVSPSPDEKRAQWIVDAFNSRPQMLVQPLTLENVKIRDGLGRVDVNPKAKFSYFIQTENARDASSPILLIPMATSRFAPTYYQTDEWWDAHKNEKPMPRQPREDVEAFLKEMKLTTNPPVLLMDPGKGQVKVELLQDFLLRVYLQKYAKNGKITVYRGAEKENETGQWEEGIRPRGVRYWTPTANYAWRYARKNPDFIPDLIAGKAPLLKFEIPVADFQRMAGARWPQLTLGTELTKKVHDGFDQSGRFRDQLTSGFDYLGEGAYGVEFEIRSNRAGADSMARYYRGTISIEELAQDRIQVIRRATERLQKQRPEDADSLEAIADRRVGVIQNEARLLLLLQKGGTPEDVEVLISKLGSEAEITRIDGFNLRNFAREKIREAGAGRRASLENFLSDPVSSMKSCGKVR